MSSSPRSIRVDHPAEPPQNSALPKRRKAVSKKKKKKKKKQKIEPQILGFDPTEISGSDLAKGQEIQN